MDGRTTGVSEGNSWRREGRGNLDPDGLPLESHHNTEEIVARRNERMTNYFPRNDAPPLSLAEVLADPLESLPSYFLSRFFEKLYSFKEFF